MQLPANLQGHDIQVRGHPVHYIASTSPPSAVRPVVLVHGIGLSHRYLVPLATAMADQVPVYVPDLPGFGRSYKPWRVQRLDELADWLADWIRALDLGAVGVLGQSFGCQVAVYLAVRHPELVARAVLQGMTVDPEARSLAQQFVRWRRNQHTEKDTKKNAPSGLPDYARCGLRRIVSTYRDAIKDQPERLLPYMACPTWVVHGDRDPIVSADWSRRVAELLPRGELIRVGEVSHTINLEDPQQLAEITIPHLAATNPTAQIFHSRAGRP